tara:strand:+ start:5259 stop:6803 length:1545 start_codon:yes stop_codon:yes gene_type:complete
MAQERTVKLQVDATDAIKDLKKVRGEIDITYAELRRTTPIDIDGTKAKQVLKNVDTEISQAAKGAKEIGSNAEASSKGFSILDTAVKGVGLSLKAMGIGLVVSAFVALQQALSKNQTVIDNVNIALETVSLTFQQIINTVVDKGQKVIDFFQKTGSAISKFFKKDLDGVTSSYEEQGKQAESLIQKNRRLAKEIVALRNEVKLAEAEQRKLQLTYQKDAEIQRQIRDDVSLTIDERIAANEKLGTILNAQFEDERSLALKRIELAEIELSKNKDNIDLQVSLINAKTELADLDERITGQRSEQLINLTSLENEYKESIKEEPIVLQKASQEEDAIEDEIIIRKQDFNQDQIDLTKARLDAVKAMEVEGGRAILNSVGQLAGEGTKMAKAAGLAGILIDTAKGISGAVAAGAGIPFPANLGAILSGVGVVLANIATAKQMFKKVKGGGGGGDISTPSPAATPPTPQGLGALTPNLEGIEQPELGGGQPTVQAFVVENDISNAQALQEELDVQATL